MKLIHVYMKILLRLHLVFYISLLAFMLTIPYNSMDANIFKMILFLVTLSVFILILTCYIVLSFNKEIKAIKKYIYANIVMMIIGIIGFPYTGTCVLLRKSGANFYDNYYWRSFYYIACTESSNEEDS